VELVGCDQLADPGKLAEYERVQALRDLAACPFDGDAHYRLGKHLLEGGKAAAAYPELSLALAFRPDLDAALMARARAALLLQRWADSAADARQALRRGVPDPSLWGMHAVACWNLGRYEEVAADLTALLAGVPASPDVYEMRGVALQRLGRYPEAISDLETARALRPDEPKGLNNLAWLYATCPPPHRDPAKALALARRAVALAPEEATYLNTLGVALYRGGQYREAVATLEKSLAAGKGQADAFDLYFLAMAHHRLGETGRARECYDRARKWAPEGLDPAQREELRAFRQEAKAVLREAPP
jgi:tetratricopeptide (TPR) repeat protein